MCFSSPVMSSATRASRREKNLDAGRVRDEHGLEHVGVVLSNEPMSPMSRLRLMSGHAMSRRGVPSTRTTASATAGAAPRSSRDRRPADTPFGEKNVMISPVTRGAPRARGFTGAPRGHGRGSGRA